MTQDTGRIIVAVRAGNADQADVGLTPGEPVEAFSVGQNGSWRVLAPGVADVHAYLYFDGATFYIASVSAGDPAWLNGRPVPTDWQPVTLPCEIALGSARLWAEVEADIELAPDEPEAATRMADASSLVAQGKQDRPKRPRIDPPKLDEATAISALRAPVPAPSQSLHVERKRDKVRQIKIRQSVREAPPDEESTRLAPVDVANAADVSRAPLPAAGRPAEPAGFSPVQPVPSPAAPVPGPPPGGYPVPGGPPVPGPPIPGPPIGGFVPPGVAATAPAYPPQGFGGAPVPAPGPPGGFSPMAAGPGAPALATSKITRKSVGATLLASWKQASIPQKAILVLMPFAIAAMFVIFDDKGKAPKHPPKTRAVATASASSPVASSDIPALSAAPAISGVTPPATEQAGTAPSEASSAIAAAPTRTPPPRRPGKEPPKSEERVAADLVAAGNFSDAAKAYQKLAAKHPDMPVFREAARILKDKASQAAR